MYITETSFTQYRQGAAAAAAMSYILAVALILLSMLNFWVLRRRSA
jgi:ABC-type sugar transport system permease subunit